MPGLRRRGGNGERRSRAHGAVERMVLLGLTGAYYTKFRGNEITARAKSSRRGGGLSGSGDRGSRRRGGLVLLVGVGDEVNAAVHAIVRYRLPVAR